MNLGINYLLNRHLGIENIHYSGMLLSGFQMLGYMIGSFLIQRMGRKTLMILTIGVSINAGLILFVMGIVLNISQSPKSDGYRLLESSVCLVNILFLCVQIGLLYPYATELFTTKNRSLAIAIMLFFAKILNGCGTFFILFMSQFDLNPNVLCLLTGLISLPCALILPETKNRKIMN